ncbi:MAG: tripartite tricarboxylate transporter substrate binding protein [Ramlibacter sp.]|jgi:tripartite-type tricarboxylate transporter receptor subunit TctC|uniref:Bug family tripartite tricarboxylate transporter substrate binding protein n=1 Tax=Ramlibacter sp. TaxID=1917967 RepID=UPI00260AE640|nr:tripartite tricarboxylate transporter substrate binding protein [Ramlibacter sp.]MDH4375937.1 tripartite tricarboxylate transporter substrate binding protein [Ramlibacter sp.]
MKRRQVLALTAASLAGALPLAARAQAFPSKALKIVVPFAAGGVADITARTVAQRMTETLGQPVVIENRPGAGGIVAADLVAKSDPDGHTLLLMSNANAVSAGLFKQLPFDPARDFSVVSLLGTFDLVLVTSGESRFSGLPEMLAWARANPGKLNIGSINIGSTQHLAAELFKSAAGLDAQVVPFNGTPAVVTALRGGQIDVAAEVLSPVLPQIRGGVLKAVAITGTRRSAALPQVPTAREAGVANLLASSWNALGVPARTPREVLERLNREVVAALNHAPTRQKLIEMNIEPSPGTPAQGQDWLASETRHWGEVIQRAGIQKQ